MQRSLYSAGMVQIFNHSLLTTTPLQISGSRASNRRIDAGAVRVYHNRVKYNVAVEFDATDKVTWGNPACCYPTAGKVTGTLTGAVTGSVALQFTATCGQATYTDRSGATESITLNQCL